MLIAMLCSMILISDCYGQSDGAPPSMADRFNSALEKAAKATGAIKNYGKPRLVEKGAQPALVLTGSSILFNNKPLVLGGRIDEWRSVIGKGSTCSPKSEHPMWCKWDALGMEITATFERPQFVSQFKIHLSREVNEDLYDILPRDAKGQSVDPVWLSKGVFPGHLEIDGFGIDKQTKFWELRSSVDRHRDLRCGLRDCSHPRGLFGQDAAIYLRLSRDDEYGVLRELAITASTE